MLAVEVLGSPRMEQTVQPGLAVMVATVAQIYSIFGIWTLPKLSLVRVVLGALPVIQVPMTLLAAEEETVVLMLAVMATSVAAAVVVVPVVLTGLMAALGELRKL